MASFRKRGKSWEYRISYKDPFDQEYKIKSKGGFLSKKEAQAAASLVEVEIEEGFEINRQPLSLSSFLRSWLLEYKKAQFVKIHTFCMRGTLKNISCPTFKI